MMKQFCVLLLRQRPRYQGQTCSQGTGDMSWDCTHSRATRVSWDGGRGDQGEDKKQQPEQNKACSSTFAGITPSFFFNNNLNKLHGTGFN